MSGGSVASADSVSILNNAGFGSFVNFGSTLIGTNMNVQNNALGLRLSTHALLMLSDSNVSNKPLLMEFLCWWVGRIFLRKHH